MATNAKMVCLNWMLVILSAIVQTSLMVFYSLGIIQHDTKLFKEYTMVMTYVHVIGACITQIALAFILAIVSVPLEVMELPAGPG